MLDLLEKRQLLILFKKNLSEVRNIFSNVSRESLLKLFLIMIFLAFFLLGAYFLFLRSFYFLSIFPGVGPLLVERVLRLSFAGVFLMLLVSVAVNSYTTLYRTKDVEFLFSLPISPKGIFFYKSLESFFFSCWSVFFLYFPLILAYASIKGLGVFFVLAAFLFSIPFVFLSALIGTSFTSFTVYFFPRKRRDRLLLGVAIGALLVIFNLLRLENPVSGESTSPYVIVNRMLSHTRFLDFALLPSYWLSRITSGLVNNDFTSTNFFFLVLISNMLFFLLFIEVIAKKLYYGGWLMLRQGVKQKEYSSKLFERVADKILFFFKAKIRAMAVKDIKTFIRDSRQWIQFALFFGFIGIYILNLRTLPFNLGLDFWKKLISMLNLAAVSLTTAMFNIRFVFPALSLEGMRFWVLGLAPIKRKHIIIEKWLLSLFVSIIISESLIVASCMMLGISGYLFWLSVGTIFLECFGISGLAVGIGAIFPYFKEDNPVAIISGFGGTLLLILSLLYVGIAVALEAFLCWNYNFLYLNKLAYPLAIGVFGLLFFSLSAGIFPLRLGLKRLEAMEFLNDR